MNLLVARALAARRRNQTGTSPSDVTSYVRSEERIAVALPVVFEGGEGLTRDVSASGMFVETEAVLPLGARVDLLIDFREQTRQELWVKCEADVLRIEEKEPHRGIAAAVRWHTD
jgi:hypothetical protein